MQEPEESIDTKTLQCPSCGLQLYEGHFTFPRCHRCDTLVQTCRYCVSYEAATGRCIEPTSPVESVTDPDALTVCPLFKQAPVQLEEEAPLFGRSFWIYTGIGLAAVVAIVVLLQHLVFGPLRQPTAGLDVRIGLPDILTASRPWQIDITIANVTGEQPLGFRIEFPPDTVRRFEILDPNPPPLSKEERRGTQRMTFEAVSPGQYLRLTVPVQPRRAGRMDFEMLVTDERGRVISRCSGRKLEVEP